MNRTAVILCPFKIALITALVIFLSAAGIFAMQSLDDAELADIHGARGFSEFTMTDMGGDRYEMKVWLNINTEQYTTIDNLKLGWSNQYDYKNPNPEYGWDHDWYDVTIGSEDEYFTTEGFYFKAEFEDFSESNRKLNSITYGMDFVKGSIHADFETFSGVAGEFTGRRMPFGPGTLEAGGTGGFELKISFDEASGGFWMTFEDTTFIPDI